MNEKLRLLMPGTPDYKSLPNTEMCVLCHWQAFPTPRQPLSQHSLVLTLRARAHTQFSLLSSAFPFSVPWSTESMNWLPPKFLSSLPKLLLFF